MALHHAQPGEVVSLRPLGVDLRAMPSTALVKTDRFEAIRLVILAGATMPEHHVSGHITLYCLEGRVQIGSVDATLASGDWIYLDRGAAHSVVGLEDSSLLLTILFDPA